MVLFVVAAAAVFLVVLAVIDNQTAQLAYDRSLAELDRVIYGGAAVDRFLPWWAERPIVPAAGAAAVVLFIGLVWRTVRHMGRMEEIASHRER